TQTSTETTTQTTTSDGSSQPYGEISPSATTVSVGERVYFELSANESWLTGIEWDLGDGTTDTGSWFVAHTYDDPGSYTVTLRTQSGHTGEWTTDRVTIDVV
ncbi:MAG: PKD domain-containing protein, partial [Halococcoides sp.]